MKLFNKNIASLLVGLSIVSCTNILDLDPKDKIPGDVLFSDPVGLKLYMADLYYYLPVEDFNYSPSRGFHIVDGVKDQNNGGCVTDLYGVDAAHSAWTMNIGESDLLWWEEAYQLNRSVNLLIREIPDLDIEEYEKTKIIGETAFIRAYLYYALAKRYGGVPLIKEVQEYIPGQVDNLIVERSTEKETWDFVMEECDRAIANLPESANEWGDADRRATKWVALALKSRAALHAASVAKYWNEAPLSGKAADLGLVGMDEKEADRYYLEAIKASELIMDSGRYRLYRSNPSNPEEAAANYQALFENPNVASEEAIFIKGFVRPGNNTSHNYDWWYNPHQTVNGGPYGGRMNPTLDLIDLYESYNDPGKPSPVITTEDGNIGDYNGFNRNKRYLKFDDPGDIFKDKDARFFASINYPGTMWKGVKIVIQGGLIRPNGTTLILTDGSYTHTDGKTYYTYGAESQFDYSGFSTYGSGNMTRSGFLMRKFLQEKIDVTAYWRQSTTDYIDMRYAEVLLNYAEAVIESGYTENNAQQRAKDALNAIRFRAGHTVEIPLTLENVLRERRIELAFENRHLWDMMRRREMHVEIAARKRTALMPLLDLRGDHPQYVMVRTYLRDENARTFQPKWYYRPIPGTGTTGLVQNPQY